MTARYTDHDQQRHRESATLAEGDQHGRTPFVVDRDRIAEATAFERLSRVAQIDEPRLGSRPHHRQAHSRAVAQLGRAVSGQLGTDADLVEAGCMAHDLGHPPFGHDGERALAAVTEGHGGFEANAQTLRILTRLAPLSSDRTPPEGLHLTRATLDATCKYPFTSTAGNRKFGAYPDDVPALTWLREGAPPDRRCLEAQIMDWADDVANAVHDLTHGVLTKRIPMTGLLDQSNRAALASIAATDITTLPLDQIQAAADDLADLPAVHCLGGLADSGADQNDPRLAIVTTHLLHRYVPPVVDATLARHDTTTVARHHADLHLPAWARAEVAVLTALTLHHVLRNEYNLRRRARRMNVIAELCEYLTRHAPATLGPDLQSAWHAAADDGARLRIVVDHVANLTDEQAVQAGLRLRRNS